MIIKVLIIQNLTSFHFNRFYLNFIIGVKYFKGNK